MHHFKGRTSQSEEACMWLSEAHAPAQQDTAVARHARPTLVTCQQRPSSDAGKRAYKACRVFTTNR